MIGCRLLNIIALFVVLLAALAGASTTIVPAGTGLSAALSSSLNGDVLQLQAGTYTITSEVVLSDGGARTILGAGSGTTFIQPVSADMRFLTLNGGSLAIQDVTIQNFARSANVLSSIDLVGGVILVESGTLQLTSCICSNNDVSSQDGAVIGTTGTASKTIELTGCAFNANTAAYGSAVALEGSNEAATLTVTGCSFDSNVNTQHGVLYTVSTSFAVMVIQSSSFSNNQGSDRGAVTPESGAATITGSTFTANQADSGAAVAAYGATPVTIVNCTFVSNYARSGGGAIRYAAEGGFLTLQRSVFRSNQALNQAGAVEIDIAGYRVEDCLFEGNIAPIGAGLQFPLSTTYATDNDNYITRCTFVDNVGSTGGGGMWATANMTVTDCTFTGNTAGQGGGIYVKNGIMTVVGGLFAGNSARSGGGLYATAGVYLAMNGTVLVEDNTASNDGGGISIDSSSWLLVADQADVVLTGNEAELGGGLSLSASSLLTTTNGGGGLLNISGNTAAYGAALYVDASSYEMCSRTDSGSLLLAGNTASIAGGAVYYDTNDVAPACPHIAGAYASNSAPYGSNEASAPSSITWQSSVPSSVRVGQHFLQEGVLRDIFNVSITASSNLISFVMSITAANDTPAAQLKLVELVGLTTTAPRDLDGSVRFSPSIASLSGLQLPLHLVLSIASRPYSLPTQTFPVVLSACTGGYVTLQLHGQQFCLQLLDASAWTRAIAGACAGIGLLFVIGLWGLLVAKRPLMLHFGRVASPACLHAVCFGSLLVLVSVFTWMADSDTNCTARPWLAVIGLTIALAGLFVVSFADVLRAHGLAPNDALLLFAVLVVALTANIIVLAIWTADAPYQLYKLVDETSNTLKQYCQSSSQVYIWILVGFYAGFGGLFLISLLMQTNYTFRYRQSKHFPLYSVQAAVVSAALIPVAAVYFTNLDIFFLVVTLGLVGVAILPIVPLLGLRAYRVFDPMTGLRLENRVDWLRNDHKQRNYQISQISGSSLGADSRFSLRSARSNPSGLGISGSNFSIQGGGGSGNSGHSQPATSQQ